MRLLIGMSRCPHGGHLRELRLTPPGRLWPERRLSLSAAVRRKSPSTGVRSPARPAPAPRLSSVLPRGPLGALSALCPHTPAGRARAVSRTPVAFASSSSAASAPPPAGAEKGRADAGEGQAPAAVPLEDVKRILQLARPERWRLAGKTVRLSGRVERPPACTCPPPFASPH